MTNLEQAARMALEALEKTGIENTGEMHDAAITSLRQALEQAKQEPVAWYDKHGMITHDPFEGITPLYIEPPTHMHKTPPKCIVKDCENHADQGLFIGDLCTPCHNFTTTGEGIYSQAYRNTKREWDSLTEEEISAIAKKLFGAPYDAGANRSFARAIEAALKTKNT